ncbi:hypothetical protein LDENG_00234390, partial [Lucifuga dentata]
LYPPITPPDGTPGSVPGYESTGGYLPPPVPLQPVAPPQPSPGQDDWSIPSLSEVAAREAFKSYVSAQCCYSKSPATEGVITNVQPCNMYRYRLETFTESRSTDWAHKPHEGEMADFYTQTAPRPWEIHVTPPTLFTNHTEKVHVPYTSSVKECHTCHGSGKLPCEECHGTGYKECWVCHGADENCSRCNSTGRDSCSKCTGQGSKECDTCKGKGQLLTFIELKVECTNHVEDSAVEQSCGLSVDQLRSVSGKELFKNSQNLVYPLLGFPNPAVSEASERLVKDHQTRFAQTSRILQQRQTVELIPVSKVTYKWKGDSHLYFVFGNENQAFAENYPATCCCVIL